MTATRTPQELAEAFARQEAILRSEIADLNAILGLTDADHKVTYGYIGNCDANGARDHRSWMVFLPHPGRVGTSADQIGNFATGSLDGVLLARRELKAVAKGVALARSI
jgi:hypothetical protein